MNRYSLMDFPIPKGSTAWQMMKIEGEKGRAEGKKEVAIALLKEGVAPEVIARATGFSEPEMEKLKSEMRSED